MVRPASTMHPASIFLLILASVAASNANVRANFAEVIRAWSSLGWSATTVLSSVPGLECAGLVRAGSEAGVAVSCVPYAGAARTLTTFLSGITVVGGMGTRDGDLTNGLRTFQEVVTPQRPSYKTLYVDLMPHSDSFEERFKLFSKTRGFLRLALEKEKAPGRLFRVQTFRDQELVVQNEWDMDAMATADDRAASYNLQGAAVSALTMTWQPWLVLTDCHPETKKACKTHGILTDLVNIIADQYNFTWFVDEADNWGTVALTGNIRDPNATWGGSMGASFNDEYDTPLSVWLTSYDRALWCDFTTSFYPRPYGVVINRKLPPADFTLFLRPFRPICWVLGFVLLAVVGAAVGLTPMLVPSMNDAWISRRISVISAWAFFVLIEAYYGGALTMFFSSAPSIPFETGLQMYPDWKMITILGEEELVKKMALAGDPLFAEFWQRAQQDKDQEIVMPSYQFALEKLTSEPGYFLYQTEYLLVVKTFLEMSSSTPDLDIHFLPKTGVNTASFIFPKHSPWTEIFDAGIQNVIQSGYMDVIVRRWTEPLPSSKASVADAQVLEGRHFTLCGVAFWLAMAGIVGILVLEKIHKRFSDWYRRHHGYGTGGVARVVGREIEGDYHGGAHAAGDSHQQQPQQVTSQSSWIW